ncbi:collagenase [Streptomyces iconiensis]|uniref:microbial collagenase n=1 Tax=Streptomyces iconiensis TaxID=1384038 RepID=A0ABT7A4V4_9ACTN|nr:collagenase [Streptomyces iconiensis]MDJ1136321.1 collagenase [Streptomyces iconiensis]
MSRNDRRSSLRRLTRAVCAGAVALSLGLTVGGPLSGPPAQAAAGEARTSAGTAPRSAPGPAPADPAAAAEHVRGTPLKVRERAPLSASKDALKREHGERNIRPSHQRPSMKTATKSARGAACSPGDFTSRTGAALVKQITSSTTDCVNTLFGLTGADARGAFRQEQMVTVANALRDGSAVYPGDGSTGMPQIVLYLRAGYYVHWYNKPDVGEYGPKLKAAIQRGLDAFFASGRSHDVTDANGETLAEAVTLIDSAEENARYVSVVQRMLEGYDSSYNDKWWMLNAVNNVYTVLWRGHQLPEFVRAIEYDPRVLDTLHTFASDHLAMLGGEQSYLVSNAGREMSRFVQHAGLKQRLRPLMKDLLGLSRMTGRTAQLWVGVAEMADAYDKDNCAYYGVCDLQQRLRDAVLADRQACSGSISVIAQDMAGGDFSTACASLNGQDAYFHEVARDRGPVKDDKNTRIEVVVFDSSADYQTYAGVIYGIDTNNGGMYLEGDPSAEGNLPRFIAYEAEWTRPDFQIWNLNHEYTHYLDGRFNMYGDFGAGVSTPTIWWIEGFAEYISYSYRGLRYDEAIAEAGKKTYRLSELFDTTYENGDTTRVYRWGYLAVRYMLERHPDDTATVLAAYRTGDWAGARRHLTETIGTRYDADWNAWLDACAAGACAKKTARR